MILTARAFNDVAKARDWYERQLPGLGVRFIAKLEETLELVERNPLAFAVMVENGRRANMARFPYGVWYVIEDQPIVIACLHHRRDPGAVTGRMLG